MTTMTILGAIGHLGSIMFMVLLLSSMTYFVIFTIGVFIRKGPLKNIGETMISDYERELKNLESKAKPCE